MISQIQERIKNTELTNKEKIIADYVLNNFREICFLTSTQLASILNTSHSSVIRFAKDLGYTGYSDLQRNIRDQYTAYIEAHGESFHVPTVKLAQTAGKLSQSSILDDVSITAQNNLQSVIRYNSPELFESASDSIIKSKVKYIVGSRGCAATSSFLSIILRDTLPMVFAEPSGSGNTFDFLSDINKNDCLIIISYPRYSELSFLAAQLAYQKGAKIVVLTDTATAPLAKYATYLFTNTTDSMAFFNSQIPALFIAETLVTYICKKTGTKNHEKLDLINHYISKLGLY